MTELNKTSSHITFWRDSQPIEAKILGWEKATNGKMAAIAINPFTKERLLIGYDPFYHYPLVLDTKGEKTNG